MASATSRFFLPSTTSWAIRCSVGVSPLEGQRRTTDTGQVVSRPLRPQRRTEGLRQLERLLPGWSGRLASAWLSRSTSPFTSSVRASSKGCGARRCSARACSSAELAARQLAPGRGEQPTASRGAWRWPTADRGLVLGAPDDRRAPRPRPAFPGETRASIASGRHGTTPGSGDPSCVQERQHRLETLHRRGGVRQGELEESEHRPVAAGVEQCPRSARHWRSAFLRVLTRAASTSPMSAATSALGNNVWLQLPVAHPASTSISYGLLGVPGRDVPVPRPAFHLGQVGEELGPDDVPPQPLVLGQLLVEDLPCGVQLARPQQLEPVAGPGCGEDGCPGLCTVLDRQVLQQHGLGHEVLRRPAAQELDHGEGGQRFGPDRGIGRSAAPTAWTRSRAPRRRQGHRGRSPPRPRCSWVAARMRGVRPLPPAGPARRAPGRGAESSQPMVAW